MISMNSKALCSMSINPPPMPPLSPWASLHHTQYPNPRPSSSSSNDNSNNSNSNNTSSNNNPFLPKASFADYRLRQPVIFGIRPQERNASLRSLQIHTVFLPPCHGLVLTHTHTHNVPPPCLRAQSAGPTWYSLAPTRCPLFPFLQKSLQRIHAAHLSPEVNGDFGLRCQ